MVINSSNWSKYAFFSLTISNAAKSLLIMFYQEKQGDYSVFDTDDEPLSKVLWEF